MPLRADELACLDAWFARTDDPEDNAVLAELPRLRPGRAILTYQCAAAFIAGLRCGVKQAEFPPEAEVHDDQPDAAELRAREEEAHDRFLEEQAAREAGPPPDEGP